MFYTELNSKLIFGENHQCQLPADKHGPVAVAPTMRLLLLFFRWHFFHAGQDGKCRTEFLVV